ncbi:uncharacterized protein [Watersipora subatra]|uniref:uncharacterized protein n=1 Tax=Watersipora subatra TaxID=2589382 RepID=UPI00355BC5FD
MEAAKCYRPNYHPYDSSLISITDRRPITQEYKCRQKIDRRFLIAQDRISIVTSLKRGKYFVFFPESYALKLYCSSLAPFFADSRFDCRELKYAMKRSFPIKPEPTMDTNLDTHLYMVHEAERKDQLSEKGKTYRDYSSYVPSKLAQRRAKEALERKVKQTKSRRFTEKMSILMFGIDSTSLNQGYRHLPRTVGYLRQNHNLVTFKGYNRLQDNTFINLYTVLTGRPVEEGIGISFNRFFDDDPLIFKWFNNDSFVTGYYEDYKTGALFNWLKKGFHYKPSDHYSKPFSVVAEPRIAKSWWVDFCYLDKGMHVWEGDWTSSFVKQYSKINFPYFLWSWTTMISHENANSLGQSDVYYYNLFRDLDKSNSLNNTILVFYSDHGYRYGGLRATKIGQNEENSPMMHWIIPEWFQRKYAKEMEIFKVNADNRLTSPYDLHRTLLDFADGALSSAAAAGMENYGKSFFEPIDEKRTCADAGISDHFCGCRSSSEYPLDDKLTQEAAQAIVDRVNELTEVNRNLCLTYQLRYIKAANINHRYDIQDSNINELLVTIGMKPSDAEFSATVHVYSDGSKKAEVKGISRVSNRKDVKKDENPDKLFE